MTCQLAKGDHAFVTHASVIYYKDAREIDLTLVETALTAGITRFVCTAHDPCTVQLLRRIQQGLIDSKQTPEGHQGDVQEAVGNHGKRSRTEASAGGRR